MLTWHICVQEGDVTLLRFSPAESALAVCSGGGHVSLWELNNLAEQGVAKVRSHERHMIISRHAVLGLDTACARVHSTEGCYGNGHDLGQQVVWTLLWRRPRQDCCLIYAQGEPRISPIPQYTFFVCVSWIDRSF